MDDTFNVDDLSWKARKRLIAETAKAVLLAAGRSMVTRELVREVAKRTQIPDARVAADLIKMADTVPWSRKTGETFVNRDGRTSHRREWFAVDGLAASPIREEPVETLGTRRERETVLAALLDNPEALRLAVLNPEWNIARARAEALAAKITEPLLDPVSSGEDDFTVYPGAED